MGHGCPPEVLTEMADWFEKKWLAIGRGKAYRRTDEIRSSFLEKPTREEKQYLGDPEPPDPNAKALQWGIGLDGQVHKAHGAPASNPTVRVTRTEHGARFRIVLPDEGKGLTVVFSDSDDGARQKRLIATSQLEFGRTWTIGSVTPIGAGRATCVVDGVALRPKVAPLRRGGLLFRDLPSEFDGNP